MVHALRGVTLDVEAGEFLSIAGPSGSGKTTLLNLIGCVDTPTSGEVTVAGQNTKQLSERALTELRLHKLGFIFQGFNLVSVLSVAQNIVCAHGGRLIFGNRPEGGALVRIEL